MEESVIISRMTFIWKIYSWQPRAYMLIHLAEKVWIFFQVHVTSMVLSCKQTLFAICCHWTRSVLDVGNQVSHLYWYSNKIQQVYIPGNHTFSERPKHALKLARHANRKQRVMIQ